jgi:hypothetical protein
MESQVELKEDEYVDLYEDKSEEHRDKPEPDDPEME